MQHLGSGTAVKSGVAVSAEQDVGGVFAAVQRLTGSRPHRHLPFSASRRWAPGESRSRPSRVRGLKPHASETILKELLSAFQRSKTGSFTPIVPSFLLPVPETAVPPLVERC